MPIVRRNGKLFIEQAKLVILVRIMDTNESLGPTVQVDFTLSIGQGRLEASLEVPSGDITITQLLPVLQTLSSKIVDSTVEIVEREGYQISCRAGCGACCRQMVPLSIFEAEGLAQWVRSLPQEQQDALEARFKSTLLALRDTGILERLGVGQWGSPEARALAVDYHKQNIPCPFLEDESCGIRPIRPLICREYLVTSPAEFCSAPSENQVVVVPIPIRPSNLLFKLGAHLENNAHGWIPLVYLFAWMKSGAQPGNAISGPGPEVLYEFVRHLEPS